MFYEQNSSGGAIVENESITDTLIDLSSYAAIADSILFEEEKEA